MYKWFEVKNFRCFSELKFDQLDLVNLIAGKNNVGKTALLEALFLHCGTFNPMLTFTVNAFRGIEQIKVEVGKWVETPWDSLFNQFNTSNEIQLKGENEENLIRELRLRIIRQPQELTNIYKSLPIPEKIGEAMPFSSVSSQALELESSEGMKSQKFYLILDVQGIHQTPVPPPPPFPAIYLPARVRTSIVEDAKRFSFLESHGQQDLILEALKVIEPRLRRLSLILVGEIPVIHGDIGLSQLLPLPLMGEGMMRLTSLVLAIANTPNGVVLVDEIENGLHYSVLPQVWKVIGKVARTFNTQLFTTTHSLECILAAHKAFSENTHYDFRLHRLERVQDNIQVITYDQETIEGAIQMGLEVR